MLRIFFDYTPQKVKLKINSLYFAIKKPFANFKNTAWNSKENRKNVDLQSGFDSRFTSHKDEGDFPNLSNVDYLTW